MMTDRQRVPMAPTPNVETRRFWEAADEGQLLVKRCTQCGSLHYYPRALCPFCYGETEWAQTKGEGEIYSFSIMRRAPVPYAIAYVTLDEGPTIMTNIVDCDFDDIRIGQRVRLTYREAEDGQNVAMFAPA